MEKRAVKFLKPNPIQLKDRVWALLIDWAVICLYLIFLFVGFTILYTALFGTIFVSFDEGVTQVISFVTSVLPVTIAFAVMDYRGGTIGKRKRGLTVAFRQRSFGASLLRNVVKFLPWQLGHMTAIHAIYHPENMLWLVILNVLTYSILLLMLMALWRQDKRHLADFVAGTQIQSGSEAKI
ncbi:RDD family protein [Aerococcaceae bacterium NML190073]|nr:RDD family protein [Aerococcaceae bacterium NML190073]MCW6666693.1 RDD family protein [Aerococcaceae bacterium NML190938]